MRILRAPLFVLSHMRSYSSLLSHVLGSHPEIDGYCETHLRYHFPHDVVRLHFRVQRLTGEPLRGKFVLDKILHNYAMSRVILGSRRTRAVILLRQPLEVVQSIMHMGTHLDPLASNTNVDQVTGYYEARLQRLTVLAKQLGSRAAFMESEALLERTEDSLEFLQDYLGLDDPLERHYRSFEKTGKPGFGDPSPHIHSGEIKAQRQPRVRFPIAQSVAERVEAAHGACLESCMRYCIPMQVPQRQIA